MNPREVAIGASVYRVNMCTVSGCISAAGGDGVTCYAHTTDTTE